MKPATTTNAYARLLSMAVLLTACRETLSLPGPVTSGDPGPDARLAANDRCESATSLSFTARAATLVGALPEADDGVAAACGLESANGDGFVQVELEEPSTLTFVVASEGTVQAAVFAEACPVASPLGSCAASDSIDLGAGTYLVGLFGDGGAQYALSVTLRDPPQTPPGGSETCDNPPTISLATGTTTISGALPTEDDGLAAACGDTADTADAYYRFRLSAEADVTFLVASTSGVKATLLAEECPVQSSLTTCSATHRATLMAGTYLVGVYGDARAEFTLSMALSDPPETLPTSPGSDGCAAPPRVLVPAGATSLTAELPQGSDGVGALCGASEEADAFYLFEVEEPGTLGLSVASSEEVRVALLADACPVSELMSRCDLASSTAVAPGTYLVAVVGTAGQSYALLVSFEPGPALPPAGSETCDNPPIVSLAMGTTTISGELPTDDDGMAAACGDAADTADAYYRFRLTADADVTFLVASTSGVKAALLADECPVHNALATCAASDRATLMAGTYLVGLYGQAGAEFTLSMALSDPPETLPTSPGSDGCGAPPRVLVPAGGTSLRAELPQGSDGMGALCGTNDEAADAFYLFEVAEAGTLSLSVASSEEARVALLADACPAGELVSRCDLAASTAVTPGTYLAAVVGTAGQAYTLLVSFEPGPASEPMGSETCDTPPALSLAGGTVTIEAALPTRDDGLDAACGAAGSSADAYFRIRVAAAADVTYLVQSTSDVRAALLPDQCPLAAPRTACATSDTLALTADTYVLGVYGSPGATYRLTVNAADEEPVPVIGTCADPIPLTLQSDTNTLTVNFTGAANQISIPCGSSGHVERVYVVELAAAHDLTITPDTNSTVLLRSVNCTGESLGCADYWEGPMYLANLAAGTYYLVVEARHASLTSSNVTVRLLPPTPRPSNDRCSGASALTWVDGLATATGSIFSALAEPGAICGGQEGLYYSFSLAEPTALRVSVDRSYVATSIRSGSCASSTNVGCQTSSSPWCTPVLPAGPYIARMSEGSNPPTAPVTLNLAKEPEPTPPANDACAAAALLDLATGATTASGTLRGAADDLALVGQGCATSYADAGQDAFYHFTLAARSDLTISSTGNSLQVALVDGGCAAPGVVRCKQTPSSYSPLRLYGVPAGEWLLALDLYDPPSTSNGCYTTSSGAFTLSVQATPSPPMPDNDTCAGAQTINHTGGGSAASVLGTTRGATDDWSAVTCPGQGAVPTSGADVTYVIHLSEPARIRVTPTVLLTSQILYLYGVTCPTSTATACSQSTGVGALDTQFSLAAGDYYLVVDQRNSYPYSEPAPGDFAFVVEVLIP